MWPKLILGALACYRLSQMVVFDEGPFRLFDRFRVYVGCYEYGKDGQPESELGRLFSCPYCVGVWFAIPFALLHPCQDGIEFILYWFAIAGLQSFLQGKTDKLGEAL